MSPETPERCHRAGDPSVSTRCNDTARRGDREGEKRGKRSRLPSLPVIKIQHGEMHPRVGRRDPGSLYWWGRPPRRRSMVRPRPGTESTLGGHCALPDAATAFALQEMPRCLPLYCSASCLVALHWAATGGVLFQPVARLLDGIMQDNVPLRVLLCIGCSR